MSRKRIQSAEETVCHPELTDKLNHKRKKHDKTEAGKTMSSAPSFTNLSKCKTCFKFLLIIIIIPPFLNYSSLHMEQRHLKPEGTLYNIGLGQKLMLNCIGEGFPTVVFDAPTGFSSDVLSHLHSAVSKFTKVCSYDRAGLGFSERPFVNYSSKDTKEQSLVQLKQKMGEEFTVERMAEDLHRLLKQSSHQQTPFVMVGAELGALVSRFYANLYERDVSDLVLIEPLVEDLFTHQENAWEKHWQKNLIPSFQNLQFGAALGLNRLRLLVRMLDIPLKEQFFHKETILRQKHFICSPKHMSSVVDEFYFMNDSFSQMRTLFKLKQFPSNISVTIINGDFYDKSLSDSLNKAWGQSQQFLMKHIHPNSQHQRGKGEGRHLLYTNLDLIVGTINRIVKSRRIKK